MAEPLEAPGTLWALLLLISVTMWETYSFLHGSNLGKQLTIRNSSAICDFHRRQERSLPVRAFALHSCMQHVPAKLLGWNPGFAWISGLPHYEVNNSVLVKLLGSLIYRWAFTPVRTDNMNRRDIESNICLQNLRMKLPTNLTIRRHICC